MTRVLICPYCGKKFSLTYSRAFECSGCRQATFGECGYARCPSCKKEFRI